jgi:hypothetical protein
MAGGDAVVQVLAVMPPGSDAATMDVRQGGSTPAENVIVYDFDAAADEYMDYLCKLEGYDGGGLTFTLVWSASSATSGQVRWEIGIRRAQDDAEDIDGSHSYQYNGVSDTAPSASGEVSYPTIAFSDGADMDSWAEGELAIVRVHRDYDHGDDGMTGDAELWGSPLGLES